MAPRRYTVTGRPAAYSIEGRIARYRDRLWIAGPVGGSAIFSGVGAPVATGKKTAFGAPVFLGIGAPVAEGVAAAGAGTGSFAGIGAPVAAGTKNAFGIAELDGLGQPVAAGGSTRSQSGSVVGVGAPVAEGEAGQPVQTLTFIASATSTGSTIDVPATAQEGDLAVLYDRAGGSSMPSTVVPTDFANIITTLALATNFKQICSFKILEAAEVGATLTGMNGNTSNGKILLIFRGDVPITEVVAGDVSGNSSAGGQSHLVEASAGSAPLIVFGAYGVAPVTNTIDPRTFTPAKDDERNVGTARWFAWKVYDADPEDTTIEQEDEGSSNVVQAFYLEVA